MEAASATAATRPTVLTSGDSVVAVEETPVDEPLVAAEGLPYAYLVGLEDSLLNVMALQLIRRRRKQ